MAGRDGFVGRRDELATLEQAIADARDGRARLVLVTGEPGIGKTALAFEVARRAAAAGARVATGRAWEGPGAPAFWLWRECLRELGEELALPSAVVGDEARFAALEAIVARVRSAARDAPVVVVLDDVQWADVPSLLAAKLLARTARHDRVCVLATMREPDESSGEAAVVLGALRREATLLPLRGLARDDLAALAQARGVDADDAIDALADATSGNALFAVELLSDRAARHALGEGHAVPAPRGIRDVLHRHLARLDEEARDVVAWAAVGGDPIDEEALAAAASIRTPRVVAAIDAACRERVLVRSTGAIRFAHDLFRTAAYAAIGHARRAAMHEAFARVVGPRDPAARAHHLFAADPHGAAAADAALDAAAHALGRFAYEDAAALGERAAAIHERRAAHRELAHALAVLAEARLLGGDAERSTADAERAIVAARASGDAVALARAALALGLRRRMSAPNTALAALLDEALAKLASSGAGDAALRCAVEARLASALQPLLDPPRALALARTAIAHARETCDDAVLARTLHAARPAFRMLEPIDERRAIDRELLLLAERLGDRVLAAHARARVFWGDLEAGDPLAADTTLTALVELAETLRLPSHELAARLAQCVRELMQGRFAEAEATLASIEATRDRWQPATASALPLDPVVIVRMNLALARGAPVTLPEVPHELRPMMRLFFDARAGRIAEAAAAFPAIADRMLEGEVWYMTRYYLGDTCGRIGATSYADRLYELCAPFAGRHVVWTPLPGYDGAMDRILGSLAAVRGERGAALRHFDAAIAMEERLGAKPFAARSRRERAAIAPPSARVPEAIGAVPSFVREGETWLVSFGDEHARVRDADGLRYLAHLVARPDVGVPVVELFAERAAARGEIAPPSGDAGDVLDREAVTRYRARARELRDRLEEAESRQDRGAVDAAQAELAFLEEELSRAVGLGGRSRRASPDAERIRVNVTTRIRKAIDKLGEHAPRLGRHLQASIRTGTTCTYAPP